MLDGYNNIFNPFYPLTVEITWYNVAHTPILNGASFIGERTLCFLSPAMAEGKVVCDSSSIRRRLTIAAHAQQFRGCGNLIPLYGMCLQLASPTLVH